MTTIVTGARPGEQERGAEGDPAMGMTEILARFVIETPVSTLPSAAIEKAERAIVDSVGCMILGAAADSAAPLLAYLDTINDRGDSVIFGESRTASPAEAALINGTYGHSEDFDDVLSMMPAHPSVVILAALLADPPRQAGGSDLIAAYLIGLEVGAKIGLAIGNGHYKRGWHATGTLAIFSAISALARLRELSVEQTRQAFGLGASMSSGLRCNFGTMTKPFHAGWAAHNAVKAIALVQSGFTAASDAFECKAGFFETYGTRQSDMQRGLAALGKPFAILDPGLALKKYPCCYALHRPIDGVLSLRAELGLEPDNVRSLVCRVAPGALRPLVFDRPVTGLEGKFSMDYTLAAALYDGKLDCAAYSDDGVQRPGVMALLERVSKIEDPQLLSEEADPESRSAGTIGYVVVTATRTDGVEKSIRIDRPTGSPQHELTWDDLAEKFADCAAQAGFSSEKSRRAFAAWRGMRTAPDLASLIMTLKGGA